MDASTLVACFDASFSPNANIRVASELELRKLERLEGMPSCVLQIISLPSSSPSVKQAAAVYLKNRIARSWTIPFHPEGYSSTSDGGSQAGAGSSTSTPTTASYSVNGLGTPGSSTSNRVGIADSDKATIKQNILHVLVETPQQNVKVQLKTCLGTIIGEDFPEKYSELMHQVVQYIQSGQESHIEGGLLALIEVLKYYRYRRHERSIPNKICEETMPMLVTLGQHLLASHPAPAAPNSIGHILHLIAKAYKISIVSDLSPHQASQESIIQWGTFLLQIVCRIIPEDAQPQDKDDRERWSWWKAKKWAHHVLNRLYNTYGSPSQLPTNRKSFAPFAQNFEAHFAPEILKAYLRCVEQYANGQVWMSRRCVRFELEFFEDCVKPKVMWQQLKPHLDLLISRFVFPCLCLTDEELEQFDDDPVEYCRAHFGDFIEDWFSSPLTAAISFIQILVKSRKATTFMPILGTINTIVAQYPGERSAREKDGALRMLACVAETVVKTKGVGDQMQQFFVNYVFPEFTSKEGHLRVRALEMVEKFEEVDMTWPDSKRLTEMFGMVMTCVTDEALPVRVQAALALPELIRYDEVREGLGPNVGRLMQELLKMSEETDIDALSKPTRALVTNFPDELLPFATEISTTMRDSFLRLMNEIVETRAKHDPADLLANGLEGGLDDTDEKTIVAMNILQTLETLLRSIATAPPIVAQVEIILMPILSMTVQHEFIELYDDLFELAHSLTYYQRSISPNMWQFFEQMYHLLKGSGVDFVEELNNVFDNFVSYGGPFLQNNATYKNMFVEIFEESMRSDQLGAQDRVSACKLAGQTLLCLKGSMDEHLHRYVDVAMHFATRKDTKEEPLVTQELHANCLELVVVALYYNPPLTLSILQKSNVLQEFFRQWFSKLSSFTRVHDRKVCILAISNMLSSVPAEIISMAGLPNQLLKAAVNLFEGLPKALERRAELEEEFGKDDDDEDDDDESEAEEDDDLDGGDEDDVYDDDNAYQELLAAKQKEMDAAAALVRKYDDGKASNGAVADDDEEDEEDDEYEDEEGIFGSEQLFETPLDKLDSYQLFSQVVQGLQQNHGQLLQQATSTLTQQEQQALHGIITRAQQGGEKWVDPAGPTASKS